MPEGEAEVAAAFEVAATASEVATPQRRNLLPSCHRRERLDSGGLPESPSPSSRARRPSRPRPERHKTTTRRGRGGPVARRAAASRLPEMERLATTVSTWRPEILAGITTGVTNAASEGINRLIKTDARCAFGYRNPANQRLRARCTTTRRARGHLTTHTSGPHSQPRTNSNA